MRGVPNRKGEHHYSIKKRICEHYERRRMLAEANGRIWPLADETVANRGDLQEGTVSVPENSCA